MPSYNIFEFYHEVTRLDRDDFVDIDFEAIKQFEIAKFGRVTNRTKKEFIRCDRTKIAKRKGCQPIGVYDANSIMHYATELTTQVIEDGNYVEKPFTVMTLKQEAHDLCEGGRCTPGQRNGLSANDISDIASLYQTTCGKKTDNNCRER